MATLAISPQTPNSDRLKSISKETYPGLSVSTNNMIDTTTQQLAQTYTDKPSQLQQTEDLHLQERENFLFILENKINSVNDPELKKELTQELKQAFDNEYRLLQKIYQMTHDQIIKTFDQKIQQKSPNPSMSLKDYLLKGEYVLTFLRNHKTKKTTHHEKGSSERNNAIQDQQKSQHLYRYFQQKYKNLIDNNDPFTMDEELRSEILNEAIAKAKQINPSQLFLVDVDKKVTTYLINEYGITNIG